MLLLRESLSSSGFLRSALLAALMAVSGASAADRLLWHDVRLDSQGKLLSWVESPAPYDRIVQTAWACFKSVPVQPDGFRTYLTYPTFYGPNDPFHAVFSGRSWVHNPAGLFAMLTDSAILYHAYSGDREVLERVREMLDHSLAQGRTSAGDAWALVPYTSSDAGNPVYRGGTDTIYCDDHLPCGRGDGVGFLEPDKVGELGYGYLQFYEVTLEDKYLQAALRCADALAKHVREGDESHSPWPFRVDALTGTRIREDYTANTIGPIRLFDELLRLRLGERPAYARAREIAWRWLMAYPVQNNVWTQYFEDVLIHPDYRTNLNHYSALETARYLLQHSEPDHEAIAKAKRLLDWVSGFFAADSVTMGGVPEKGRQWGAEAISEQVNDMDKMSSHTARYASVRALYFEVTGDLDSKERAFRSFNWATYSARENGLVKTSLDEGTGYWFSDGYGDYMRHFQRGLASVPEWAPVAESHLLGFTSVVRSIRYDVNALQYETFDPAGVEVLKLAHPPKAIWAGAKKLKRARESRPGVNRYTVQAVQGGGFVVRVNHRGANAVKVQFSPADAG